VRANPRSVTVCDVDRCWFYRMFVAYAANVNGLKLGCRLVLFVDGTHLSRPYKGTLLSACALDTDNHLFNFAYAIVCSEKIEEWVWFLEMVTQRLGSLMPVIISDRNPAILPTIAQVFGKEYHSYCLRHLTKNFLKEAGKHGICDEADSEGNVIQSGLCTNSGGIQCRIGGVEVLQGGARYLGRGL